MPRPNPRLPNKPAPPHRRPSRLSRPVCRYLPLAWAACLSVCLYAKAQQPAGPAADTTLRTLSVNQRFAVPADGTVQLDLSVPVQLVLEGTDKDQAEVSIQGQGHGYTAEAREVAAPGQPAGVLVRLGQTDGAAAPSATPVQVLVRLPQGRTLRGRIRTGTVAARQVAGNLHLELEEGDISLTGGRGTAFLNVRRGGLACQGGRFTTVHLTALDGSIDLQGTSGQINAQAGNGSLSADSPTQPLHAALRPGQTTLVVREGDVRADTYQGSLDFKWAGGKDMRGRRFSFSARQGEATLRFPDGMGLEINLDQVVTETAATAGTAEKKPRTESEFATPMPQTKKTVAHQGKKLLVTQGQRLLNGGGNLLMIQATDSYVYLKKTK